MQRLRQLQGFKRVVAPFAGVITRRNVDVGDLIDAGGGAGRALFVLTQTDPLRVYVNVPQSYAQLVKPGQKVVVTQAELRGQTFDGEVARTAASIDAATRTMQVEVALPNRDGALLPGAYVQVALPLPASAGARRCRPTRCCSAARARASRVVDAQGRVQLRPVTLGRNFGEAIEVLDGVAARRPARAESVRFARRRRPVAVAPASGERRGRAARPARRPAAATRRRRQGARRDAATRRGPRSVAALALRARRLRRRPRLPQPAVEMPVAWKVEAPWREGTPDDARAEGAVVAALRRSRSSTRCRRRRSRDSPTLALADARASRRRARSSPRRRPALLAAASSLDARARRASASRRTGRSANYASPNFSTVQNDFVAVARRSATRSTSPAASQRTIEGARRQRRAVGGRLREHAAAARPPTSRPRYFNLRAIDIELDVLARSIALQRRALELRHARATTSAPRRASTSRSSRRCSTRRWPRSTCCAASARSSSTRSRR